MEMHPQDFGMTTATNEAVAGRIQNAMKILNEFRAARRGEGWSGDILKGNVGLHRAAQMAARRVGSGSLWGAVPEDTRSPTDRAHDNECAYTGVSVKEIILFGAVDEGELIQAAERDASARAVLMWAEACDVGVGIEGSGHTEWLVIQMGTRPEGARPEPVNLGMIESCWIPDQAFSLDNRKVTVIVR